MNTITKPLMVAAGVLVRENQVFIAQRKKGKHLAGYWEFPGGKIESNESAQDCLIREFKEEFDLQITVDQFIADYIHHYHNKSIRLISYYARIVGGEIVLIDHENCMWVTLSELKDYKLAPADIGIMKELIRIQ